MPKNNIIVGLDVGTTKIAAVMAEVNEIGEVNIIGEGLTKSYGIRKGSVVDLDDTVRSIQKVIEKTERMAGIAIDSVFLGIAGEHISSLNNKGIVAISSSRNEVTQEDVERVLEAARIIPLPSDREIIHVIPRGYIIDGQDGIRNPIGMFGSRLEVDTHIVIGSTTFIQNLLKSVQRCGLIVNELVLQQLAAAEAVLSKDEKELGVALVDIGGGTTDIIIYTDGNVSYTSVLPIGGTYIDRDIAYGLSTTISEAEEVKCKYGSAISSKLPEGELIKIKEVSDGGTKEIPVRLLSEIIEARTLEIIEMINRELQKSNYQERIPAGLVLTGGTSLLKNIDQLCREVLNLQVRLSGPRNIRGLAEYVQSPIYSTAVGLILYGAKKIQAGFTKYKRRRREGIKELMGKIKLWIREFV